MSTDLAQDRRTKMLADWQESIEDKQALLKDPEAYTQQLIEQAADAFTAGVIKREDLRELREWADAAYSWAVEEKL
ncbi:hypothetical protein [Pseudomonas syringae group genomosp. 3]|uniref:hypothetical protein n=1 Tax=Pseudomonas syringae group genomosp. 3 TaxID=251701 RepID=UPI000EFDD55E|nr:hypothetical protein [Pseudomonas syringae group genomosp. 3]RMP68441.1 hypothetical protein ALQ19_200212 [Pseudomonas syringae pv. berberidis]